MSKRSAEEGEADISSKKVKRDGNASDSGSQPTGQIQLKKDSEGNVYLDLGNMKRATVSVFKGAAQVNIREYYTDKNGDIKPGKKGVALTRAQWDLFIYGIDALSEKLKTVEAEKGEEVSKKKKKSDEKATKTKKEKPAQKKKKKKDESEDEGSDDE